MRRSLLAVAALLVSGAFAPPEAPAQRSREKITRAEIEKSPAANNALDLVRKLRPDWLRPKSSRGLSGGTRQIDAPQVYLERTKLGEPLMLESIQVSMVEEMRFYTPSEAESQFGSGHLGGAIVVTRRKLDAPRPDTTKPPAGGGTRA